MNNNKKVINFLPYILVISILLLLVTFGNGNATKVINFIDFSASAEKMEFIDVRMSVGTTVVNIGGTYENNGKLENFTVSVPKTDENIQWLSDIFAKNKNTKVEVLDANRETFMEMFLKNSAASAPIAGSAVISDISVYSFAVFSL